MNSAIIVAAGSGTRMGVHTDKLWLEAAGQPIIAHTWRRFEEVSCIQEIVLVVRPERRTLFQELAERMHFRKPFRLADGGAERQDSVWAGLQAISPDAELVAIQDGARPCTAAQVIEQTLDAARSVGAAVAAQKASDTIKESDDGRTISRHLDRGRLWTVQTPQSFRVEVIRAALQAVRRQGLVVTDDTAACELIGQPVALVAGTAPNPKVTVPADLSYIECLLRGR